MYTSPGHMGGIYPNQIVINEEDMKVFWRKVVNWKKTPLGRKKCRKDKMGKLDIPAETVTIRCYDEEWDGHALYKARYKGRSK